MLGQNALLSFSDSQSIINLKNDPKIGRTLVQSKGLKNRFGDHCYLENCWTFYQGFYTMKQDYVIELPHLDDAPQTEYDKERSVLV